MLGRFLILLAFLVPASSFAQFDIAALQARFPAPFGNAGPNCYNTTLISLGYVQEQVYINGAEVKFYLKHFCKEQNISALNAPNGSILIYRENPAPDSPLVHAASLLGNGMVFEKYNFQGKANHPEWPAEYSGAYLYHPLSESDYFKSYQADVQSVYACQSAEKVKSALSSIKSKAWSKSMDQLRSSLNAEISSLELKDLHLFLTGTAFSDLYELNRILEEKTTSKIESEYLISFALSIHGQILYSNVSYVRYCKTCDTTEFTKLDNELSKTEELITRLQEAK